MNKLMIVAQTINGNEKAMGLFETHEQAPDYSGFHRYQVIYVVRDGRVAEWRKDMGLARNFKGINQLRIPSFMEHTVDELMNLADELRGTVEMDIKDRFELEKYKPA